MARAPADPEDSSRYLLLRQCVQECNVPAVQSLLDLGADPAYEFQDGVTSLHIACDVEECYDLCKLLLEKGADCNARSRVNGVTPLFVALQKQPLEVVQLLLNHGADIDAVSYDGRGALHYATSNRHVDVLEFLLDQGLDMEYGVSVLFRAVVCMNFEACEILLRRGAIVYRSSQGYTPLIAAIITGDELYGEELKVIQLLLDYGAEVTKGTLGLAPISKTFSDDMSNTLMRHVARLEHSNGIIDDELRGIIEDEESYKRYYQACSRELESMKVAKFYDDVSVFSILMGSRKELARYAKNEELVKALEEKSDNDFPIYFASLKKRFYDEVEKQRLRRTAATVLSDLFVLNHPSHPVIRNIMCYLADEDLVVLPSNFAI